MSSAKQLKEKRTVKYIASAILAILVTLLIEDKVQWLDRASFSAFMPSVNQLAGVNLSLENSNTALLPWSNLLFLTLAASAGIWIGYKKSLITCLILLLQFNVLLICLSCAMMAFVKTPGIPISAAICMAFAMFLGTSMRIQNIKERKIESKAIELKLRNKELEESRLIIVKQDEMDRRLLAADLHDQILNDLKTVNREINNAEQIDRLAVTSSINDVMTEIRVIMDSLSPYVLEHFGLPAAIEDCLEKASRKANFDYRFKNKCQEGELENFSTIENQLIYRLIQESLTNIVKHAEAEEVRITVDRDLDQVVFTIKDDGKGFSVEDMSQESRGLTYMKLRASLIGAKISWESSPGKGTQATIRISAK